MWDEGKEEDWECRGRKQRKRRRGEIGPEKKVECLCLSVYVFLCVCVLRNQLMVLFTKSQRNHAWPMRGC